MFRVSEQLATGVDEGEKAEAPLLASGTLLESI